MYKKISIEVDIPKGEIALIANELAKEVQNCEKMKIRKNKLNANINKRIKHFESLMSLYSDMIKTGKRIELREVKIENNYETNIRTYICINTERILKTEKIENNLLGN